jgi:hypothetical protein
MTRLRTLGLVCALQVRPLAHGPASTSPAAGERDVRNVVGAAVTRLVGTHM